MRKEEVDGKEERDSEVKRSVQSENWTIARTDKRGIWIYK